jgi:hypothetical protein
MLYCNLNKVEIMLQIIYCKLRETDIKLDILPLQSPVVKLDVRGSVHHSTIHKEKSNKMQQCIKSLLFHIYMKFDMFRATHRPSSGA